MISQYDLYDMTAALVFIRNNIQYELNNAIIFKIECVLKNKSGEFQDNQIRKAIASIEGLDYELWAYVYHNNVYGYHRLLKNDDIYQLLIQMCSLLRQLLNEHKFQQAYDLVDCLHCLPNIIADNNFIIPKSYWKIYIKPYRRKWDKNFPKVSQKTENTSMSS